MADWIASLREQKVVAAMADDGRVDRLRSQVRLSNPDFNDGTYFGAIVALGTPKAHRLVQVVRPVKTPFSLGPQNTYSFVPHDPNKKYWMRLKCNANEMPDEWEYIITDKTPAPDGQA